MIHCLLTEKVKSDLLQNYKARITSSRQVESSVGRVLLGGSLKKTNTERVVFRERSPIIN